MSKVDWITWKTNPNEVIKYEKVKEKLAPHFQELNDINILIQEELNLEMKSGGLSLEALNIEGTSPAHEQALKIIKDVEEIEDSIEKINKKIQETVEEQKEIEKRQLVDAINTKIEEEEKIKNTTTILNNKLLQDSTVMEKRETEDIINNIEERIKLLKEKLEIANSI